MLALAESMLALKGTSVAVVHDATPKRPLRLSQSSAHDNTLRSSVGSERSSKTSKKLSGAEQDAVVAKIRSVAKQSASPEKALPFQDDDTPTTKSLRLKKEMEVSVYAYARTCSRVRLVFVLLLGGHVLHHSSSCPLPAFWASSAV